MNHYPTIQRLLARLQEAFPDRLPRGPVTTERIAELQGSQKVIDFIKDVLESEEEEIN